MCEFCEQYEYLKEEAKERKKENGINTYFKVRLFEYRVQNRIRKSGTNGRLMKLNYCPVCGRKLSK